MKIAKKSKNWKFYVYEILDEQSNVIYVGKGVNNRVKNSQRERKGADARIVAYFYSEDKAFEHEAERISWYSGLLNANKGGFGGREKRKKKMEIHRADANTVLINKIGTRAYAARMLVSFYNAFKMLSSKIDVTKLYDEQTSKILDNLDINELITIGYGSRT